MSSSTPICSSRIATQTCWSQPLNKKGHLLVALGVITLIGSLAAAGLLYSKLGYASLAIPAAGFAFALLSLVAAKSCCTAPKKRSVSSKKIASAAPKATISEEKLKKKNTQLPPPPTDERSKPAAPQKKSSKKVASPHRVEEKPKTESQKAAEPQPALERINLKTKAPPPPLPDEWFATPIRSQLQSLVNMNNLQLCELKAGELRPLSLVFYVSEKIRQLHLGSYSGTRLDKRKRPSGPLDSAYLGYLATVTAQEFNENPGKFPIDTLYVIDSKELIKIDSSKIKDFPKIAKGFFPKEGQDFNKDFLFKFKRLSPEVLHFFAPYLDFEIWQHLLPTDDHSTGLDLNKIDFPSLLGQFSEESQKRNVVQYLFLPIREEFESAKRFSDNGPFSYLKTSNAKTISHLAPYLPPNIWAFLSEAQLNAPNLDELFSHGDAERLSKTAEAIWKHPHYNSLTEPKRKLIESYLKKPSQEKGEEPKTDDKKEVKPQLSSSETKTKAKTHSSKDKLINKPASQHSEKIDFVERLSSLSSEDEKKAFVHKIFNTSNINFFSTVCEHFRELEPETIYLLAPYLPTDIWKYIGMHLLKTLNFESVFKGIPNESDRETIVNAIFHDVEKYSEGLSGHYFNACPVETIYQFAPYLPRGVWGSLNQTERERLDFEKLFSKLSVEKKKITADTIVHQTYYNHISQEDQDLIKSHLLSPEKEEAKTVA